MPREREPEVGNQVLTGWVPSGALREKLLDASLLAAAELWQSLSFLGLEMRHSALCPHLHIAFLSVSQCVLVRLLQGPLTGFRATLILYDLILIPTLITSAKTLFLNKATFRGGPKFGGDPVQHTRVGRNFLMGL